MAALLGYTSYAEWALELPPNQGQADGEAVRDLAVTGASYEFKLDPLFIDELRHAFPWETNASLGRHALALRLGYSSYRALVQAHPSPPVAG